MALGASALLGAWVQSKERVLAERLGQSDAFDVRMMLYDPLAARPSRALQGRSRGGVMLRLVGDLTALRPWVSLGLAHGDA